MKLLCFLCLCQYKVYCRKDVPPVTFSLLHGEGLFASEGSCETEAEECEPKITKNQIHFVLKMGLTEEESWAWVCLVTCGPFLGSGCQVTVLFLLKAAQAARFCRGTWCAGKEEVRVGTDPKICHADIKILALMHITQDGTENGRESQKQ